ncbi:FAD-dependent oxidoreductase [Vibrio sp. HB161653]|uniref:FAD-dependent oxidoreductase n=2 Tax=unclassified Vibrio TaxID=2614977 RepID=A0AB39HKS0_9VIBR|nr:FAD-dependent oxidoreductase [Vibrio sp. HB161653]MDP5252987.1 FAD-dependent oxidoreductase [Vibrio sp. HB161653]
MKSNEGKHIGIIGGGVAGSTAAIHFTELGFKVSILEKGPSLVNGPPICHLHAGGNLYREISQQQCVELLKQSIDSVRLFPHSINVRPTVIAVPKSDGGTPEDLLPRLETIQSAYQQLVDSDEKNRVLGDPNAYYRLLDRDALTALAKQSQPKSPKTLEEWCIPFAKNADLEQLKYPVVVVQEYGWSVFRLAALAHLTLDKAPNCQVMTQAKVQHLHRDKHGWQVQFERHGQQENLEVDYLINACGFRTGVWDDEIGASCERLVEFKSAYVTRWHQGDEQWPEVIFHGPRGTDKGMAQLTPYGNGVFQLHGMTPDITLFDNGLVSSDRTSSQPKLDPKHIHRIDTGWEQQDIDLRTTKAIAHVAQFIPSYQTAQVAGKPLFGAQQIPGRDPSLRASDVSFFEDNYARIEIVKASSTLYAAQKIAAHWFGIERDRDIERTHSVTTSHSLEQTEQTAMSLATLRQYPVELAQVSGETSTEEARAKEITRCDETSMAS